MLTGAVSALAGIYYTLRFGSARGDNATGLELPVIAAVLLGGVSIFGGRGALHGVIAGVLLIGVLASALRLANVTSDVINIITGVLLVLSVVSTSFLAWLQTKRQKPGGEPEGSAAHSHVVGAALVRFRFTALPTTERKNNDVIPHPSAAPRRRDRGPRRDRRPRRHRLLERRLRTRLHRGSGGGDANLAITFLPKNLGNAYFDTSDKGGKKAIKEFSGTYAEVGPAEATPDAQVSYINTLTQQGVGAIVVSANDPTAICDALNEARDAGVKVVTFDSDTNPECRDLFINQATADGIAKVQVDMIAEQIGDAGEVAILSATANATNQNAWIDLMKKDLAANHPNIKLVDTVYGDDDDQTSFDKTAALLQTYPNLKGIISPTTVGIAAAARYLSTSDFKGKVALTGLGTPNQMRDYVKDGTVTEFALWNPADLGYLAAYAAKALIDGDITGKEGDTFNAGKLGDFTVGADGTVLLGDPFTFNKDNIGDFDF